VNIIAIGITGGDLKMNSKERIIATLECKEPDRIPVFEWVVSKKVIKAVTGSEDPVELVEELDLDAINFRADYMREYVNGTTYIDEWGCKKSISPDGLDTVIEHPVKDIADHARYKFPDPHAEHRFTSLERAMKRVGDNKAVILTVRDVLSDIRDLLGYENALIAMITQKDMYSELLDRVIQYNLELADIACQKHGVYVIATSDDYATANGLIFSPELFRSFLGPKFRELIDGFKRMGYYYIKHTDGNIMSIIDYIVDSGIDCLDPIDPLAGMDIGGIKKRYGTKICIKGNIDNTSTLTSGTLQQVEEEVKTRIQQAGPGGGYILSSSNTIHSGVKPENFIHMVKSANKYGKYPL